MAVYTAHPATWSGVTSPPEAPNGTWVAACTHVADTHVAARCEVMTSETTKGAHAIRVNSLVR
jgi:hypothetical protein